MILYFRNLNGYWKSTDWLIVCSLSTWRWTVLTPCFVRPTTMSQLHMDALRCTSSGNSTSTSYQTTVTMAPPTGPWTQVADPHVFVIDDSVDRCVESQSTGLCEQPFPLPKSLRGTSLPMFSHITCMAQRSVSSMILNERLECVTCTVLRTAMSIFKYLSLFFSPWTLLTPTSTVPTGTLLDLHTSKQSAGFSVTKASLWWWRSCSRLSRAW